MKKILLIVVLLIAAVVAVIWFNGRDDSGTGPAKALGTIPPSASATP